MTSVRPRWLLAALVPLVSMACGGGDGTGPGPVGSASVRVETTTTGVLLDANGYEVTLNGSEVRSIEADGSVTFSEVAPGTHQLEISGNEINCAFSTPPIRTIDVPANQTTTAAFDAECGYLIYVHNAADRTVSVVETLSHTVGETLPLDAGGILINPDQSVMYVPIGLPGSPDRIDVLVVATHEVIDQIAIDEVPGLWAITPDASRFVMVHGHDVSIVDAQSFETLTTTTIDAPPNGVVRDLELSPDGTLAYLPIYPYDEIVVLDVGTGAIDRRIDALYASKIVLSPDGQLILGMADFPLPGAFYAIDTRTDQRIATTSLPGSPNGIAVSPDGAHIVVAHVAATGVTVLDGSSFQVAGTAPLGGALEARFRPDGKVAYITNAAEAALVVLDPETVEVLATVDVGDTPRGFVIAGRP